MVPPPAQGPGKMGAAAMATGQKHFGGAGLIQPAEFVRAESDFGRTAGSLERSVERDRTVHHHDSELGIPGLNANQGEVPAH